MAAPSPTNLQVFENAIYSWFKTQTGLTNVRWADQDHPQFKYPFGLITPLTGMMRVENGFDETRETVDLLAPAGTEVSLNHTGWREISISFQVWIGPPDNNNPQKNARDYLSRAQGSLNLISVREAFLAAGIAVIEDMGIVKNDAVIEDAFISIATMDIRFMTVSSVVETTGYIATTGVEGTLYNADGIVEETFNDIFGDS